MIRDNNFSLCNKYCLCNIHTCFSRNFLFLPIEKFHLSIHKKCKILFLSIWWKVLFWSFIVSSLFVKTDINCVILKSIMLHHFLYEFFQGRYRFLNNLISRYFAPVKIFCFSAGRRVQTFRLSYNVLFMSVGFDKNKFNVSTTI